MTSPYLELRRVAKIKRVAEERERAALLKAKPPVPVAELLGLMDKGPDDGGASDA